MCQGCTRNNPNVNNRHISQCIEQQKHLIDLIAHYATSYLIYLKFCAFKNTWILSSASMCFFKNQAVRESRRVLPSASGLGSSRYRRSEGKVQAASHGHRTNQTHWSGSQRRHNGWWREGKQEPQPKKPTHKKRDVGER